MILEFEQSKIVPWERTSQLRIISTITAIFPEISGAWTRENDLHRAFSIAWSYRLSSLFACSSRIVLI